MHASKNGSSQGQKLGLAGSSSMHAPSTQRRGGGGGLRGGLLRASRLVDDGSSSPLLLLNYSRAKSSVTQPSMSLKYGLWSEPLHMSSHKLFPSLTECSIWLGCSTARC